MISLDRADAYCSILHLPRRVRCIGVEAWLCWCPLLWLHDTPGHAARSCVSAVAGDGWPTGRVARTIPPSQRHAYDRARCCLVLDGSTRALEKHSPASSISTSSVHGTKRADVYGGFGHWRRTRGSLQRGRYACLVPCAWVCGVWSFKRGAWEMGVGARTPWRGSVRARTKIKSRSRGVSRRQKDGEGGEGGAQTECMQGRR